METYSDVMVAVGDSCDLGHIHRALHQQLHNSVIDQMITSLVVISGSSLFTQEPRESSFLQEVILHYDFKI